MGTTRFIIFITTVPSPTRKRLELKSELNQNLAKGYGIPASVLIPGEVPNSVVAPLVEVVPISKSCRLRRANMVDLPVQSVDVST
jgi:hypothetical protein